MTRRIVTVEIDESRLTNWHAEYLRNEGIDFFGWLLGDNTLPETTLAGCGIRITSDIRRRPHIVRDWNALRVGDRVIVATRDELASDDAYRRLRKQTSAGCNMASKRHSPKKFVSQSRAGQISITRVA